MNLNINLNKILSSLFIVLAITACKEDFLEVNPKSTLTENTFFQSEGDFQQALVGVYSPLRNIIGVSDADRPGTGAWIMAEMRSDNTHYIINTGNRGFTDAENIDAFLDGSTDAVTADKYTNNYILIGRANNLLEQIDAATFDQGKKDYIKGQALFLRAFAYFDLVQYFGDVPLVLKSTKNSADAFVTRTSKDKVYEQIIIDAKVAAELMPGRSNENLGRATKATAKTLLGNVYIVLKQWANAEVVLKEVTTMGYILLPKYADIYKASNKNNEESIFEVQFMQGTQGQHSNFIYNFLPRLDDISSITGVAGPANSRGGWNTPTPDLIEAYEEGDSRKDASIGMAGGFPYIKKYLNPHTTYNNTDDNWPVYRYAEVLLLLAEALNKQEKSPEALTYLNQVRDRAFGAGVAKITTTDPDILDDIIFHERQVELAFENKRWLDLVRTGRAIEVMKAHGEKIKANKAAYYYPASFDPFPASYNLSEKNLLFPIPNSQRQINPELSQNPGY